MSVWFAIPSALPAAQCNAALRRWSERGYRTAVYRDPGEAAGVEAHLVLEAPYAGYAQAVNRLCRIILDGWPKTEWIVTGGDDVVPVPDVSPDAIASECTRHFGGTFGVMEPTGDGSENHRRCAVAPWLGAEWCRRMYGGEGPYWPGWFHFWVDAELHDVASMLGAYWERPDLCQLHKHWTLTPGTTRPAYLTAAAARNEADHQVYLRRKAGGFPGHEPTGS